MHWNFAFLEHDILLLQLPGQQVFIQLQDTKQLNIWKRSRYKKNQKLLDGLESVSSTNLCFRSNNPWAAIYEQTRKGLSYFYQIWFS